MEIKLEKAFGSNPDTPTTISTVGGEYVFRFPQGTFTLSVNNNYANINFVIHGFKKEWEQYKADTSYIMFDVLNPYITMIENFLATEHLYPDDLSLDLKEKLYLAKIIDNYENLDLEYMGYSPEEDKEAFRNGRCINIASYLFICSNVNVTDGFAINSNYDPSVDYDEFWTDRGPDEH